MNQHCQDALDKLYAYLDRELDGDSVLAIRSHIEGCPPCGSAFVFEERLLVAIKTGLREDVPPLVIERIRQTIRAEFR